LNELKKSNIGKAAEDARPLDFPKRPEKDRESPDSRSLCAGLSETGAKRPETRFFRAGLSIFITEVRGWWKAGGLDVV
jgi:hypothetical protein